MENKTEAFVDYVDGLLKATLEGKIDWSPFNPTTFIWDKETPPTARLILQRVEQAGRLPRYLHILTVTDMTPNPMNVILNGSSEDPRVNEKLGVIYDSIKLRILEKELDFLKSTLPK